MNLGMPSSPGSWSALATCRDSKPALHLWSFPHRAARILDEVQNLTQLDRFDLGRPSSPPRAASWGRRGARWSSSARSSTGCAACSPRSSGSRRRRCASGSSPLDLPAAAPHAGPHDDRRLRARPGAPARPHRPCAGEARIRRRRRGDAVRRADAGDPRDPARRLARAGADLRRRLDARRRSRRARPIPARRATRALEAGAGRPLENLAARGETLDAGSFAPSGCSASPRPTYPPDEERPHRFELLELD
jgi:hypothetical protein